MPAHAQRMSSLLALDREGVSCRVDRGACGAGRGMRVGRRERRRATAVQAACSRGLDCRLGEGHGEERTLNMPIMFVALEVSKLSGWLNASASCRESKGEGNAG